MITTDKTGNKKYSMNPQVGKAMSGAPPATAKPAAAALPGTMGDMDEGSGAMPAAEPLNVTCPTCGAQIPVTADNIAQPEQAEDMNSNDNGLGLGGASSDAGDMA